MVVTLLLPLLLLLLLLLRLLRGGCWIWHVHSTPGEGLAEQLYAPSPQPWLCS
jgi:hypothetical protein